MTDMDTGLVASNSANVNMGDSESSAAHNAGAENMLLERISTLIDKKFDQFKQEVAYKTDESIDEMRRIRFSERRVFNHKGNKKQYEFNEKILDCMDTVSKSIEHRKYDNANAVLEKGKLFLQDRQKLILIADTEKLGWKVAEEYEFNELCTDEEDQRKLWRAVQRAEKRAREDQKEVQAKRRRTAGTTPHP